MGLSLPDKFRESVADVIEGWSAFEKAHGEESPVSIRINPNKFTGTLDLPQVPWNQNGYYLKQRPHFTMDPWFHAGVYYPQEPGSMMLDHVLRQLPVEKENLRVLDLCAAPGGKSSLILDWLDGDGFLVSNEVIGKRARILRENLDKWGHANRLVSNSDPKHFGKLGKVFDIVVIDAPCSGEGMFRKEADALNMWSEDLVEHCHQRQRRILNDALACLKPGGFLIYSTCTYNTRENEEVLAPLLKEHGARSVSLDIPESWDISVTDRHGIFGCRCFPHRVLSEGFFIAALQLPGQSEKKPQKKKSKRQSSSKIKVAEPVTSWLTQPDRFSTIEHHRQTYFLPRAFQSWVLELAAKIHVLTIGVEAGKIIREILVPAAPMALSLDLNQEHLTSLELTDDQVIDYLCKQDIQMVSANNGWTLCKYRQMPIGWAKTVEGKLKNHWPKEWRIRHSSNSIAQVIPES